MYSKVKQLCQCAVYGKRSLAMYYYLFVELNSVRVVAGLCEVTQCIAFGGMVGRGKVWLREEAKGIESSSSSGCGKVYSQENGQC